MITFLILGKYNQVITALVRLPFFQVHRTAGDVHLTTDNRFKELVLRLHDLRLAGSYLRLLILTLHCAGFNPCNPLLQILDFPFRTAILLIDIVRKFLDAEHISMIGHGNTLHSILHCFIDQTSDASLTVQKGILRMDV